MPLTCASCATENPDQARFCLACGSPIGAKAEVRRERKFVAMLFADLVGSTALGEREDPEVVQDLVSGTFTRLGTEIERFGGTVDKIMGDAILALFGVPAAHEDDPERAVRAALEMQSVLATINAEADAAGRPRLEMRVGVEAGEVMVNLERTPDLPDRMVTGDAANTASRLQSAAEPGRVVVGPAVYAASSEVIDYHELPPVVLKGKAEAVPVWVATGVKTRHGERTRLGLESALVGRDDELGSLKQAFHRVVSTARPALVTVVGPAGVGKSRIAWELSKYVDGLPESPTWMRGRCYAYGNRSYSALGEAIKARCGVHEDDQPEAIRAAVREVVGELFGDEDGVAEGVEALVGGSAERGFLREELFEAWRRFLERDAARRPLVLLLEDIHWADEGLLDFLDHMAEWGQGPILALTLARPELLEHRPGWGGGLKNYSALYLDALSEGQNAEMLTRLLGAEAPEGLRRLVLDRSEGNPLFTEEIVRSLIDRGVLRTLHADSWELATAVEDIEMPRSVQGVIASRLDALPADEKRALQDGAVVGRVFWLGALAALDPGRDADAGRRLTGRLRLKEILIPREPSAFAGDPEFGFRHVLIRDVAYESMPKAERAAKHAQVAAWFEEVAGDRVQEFAEQIATHHAERARHLAEVGGAAADREEADRDVLRWARAAALRAQDLREVSETIRWYRHAIDAARSLRVPAGEQAELLEAQGWVELSAGRIADGSTHLREALVLREEQGSEVDAARLQALLGTIAFQNAEQEQAMTLMGQAFGRLQPFGDTPELAFALTFMSLGIFFGERPEEAEPHLRRALAMAEAADPDAGYIVTHTLSLVRLFLVMGLVYLGRWEEAQEMAAELETLARSSGDVAVFLRARNMTVLLMHDGLPVLDMDRIDEQLRESLDLARKSGRLGDGIYTIDAASWVAITHGRLDEAEALATETIEWSSHGAEAFEAEGLRRLSWIALIRGHVEEAERLLKESGERVTSTLGKLVRPMVSAGIARARGDLEGAAAILTETAVDTPTGAWIDLWDRLLIEAVVVLTELGRVDEAAALAERLRRMAGIRVQFEPLAQWAEGLVAASSDPALAASLLGAAAAGCEERVQPIDVARCLLALGAVQAGLGDDARPALERARELLVATGAGLYLPAAEAALAAAG